MLERIGFKYVERIDPFDGGPHFEANVADVTLVRRYRTVKLAANDFEQEGDDVLVAAERESGRNRFRAVRTQARVDDQLIYLPGPAKEALGVSTGAKLSLIPFE
jgi:arginine N-succinyltransferase